MSDENKKGLSDEFRQSVRVPFSCPICSAGMYGKSTNTFYDYGCCILCFIEFVEDRERRWKNGWRPTQKEIKDMHDRYGLNGDIY